MEVDVEVEVLLEAEDELGMALVALGGDLTAMAPGSEGALELEDC